MLLERHIESRGLREGLSPGNLSTTEEGDLVSLDIPLCVRKTSSFPPLSTFTSIETKIRITFLVTQGKLRNKIIRGV